MSYRSAGPSASGKVDSVDFIIMENVFYNREVQRVYDLKGSERDRYVSKASESGGMLLGSGLESCREYTGFNFALEDLVRSFDAPAVHKLMPHCLSRCLIGTVLLDENLKEISLRSPLSMTSSTFARLRDILQRDTGTSGHLRQGMNPRVGTLDPCKSQKHVCCRVPIGVGRDGLQLADWCGQG